MLENRSDHPNHVAQSPEHQVQALLRLVQDLGYDVQASPAGDWTVSIASEQGDRTIVGVDSAREVVALAHQLAESLQVDRKVLPTLAPAT